MEFLNARIALHFISLQRIVSGCEHFFCCTLFCTFESVFCHLAAKRLWLSDKFSHTSDFVSRKTITNQTATQKTPRVHLKRVFFGRYLQSSTLHYSCCLSFDSFVHFFPRHVQLFVDHTIFVHCIQTCKQIPCLSRALA